jgi:hypothetical protein
MSYDKNRYRPGLGRDVPAPRIAHRYEVDPTSQMDFGNPMCIYGWNRDSGESYSIWRGNVGTNGICKFCIRRASRGLDGLPSKCEIDDSPDLDWREGATSQEIAEIEAILRS